jgi:hypothetical protein
LPQATFFNTHSEHKNPKQIHFILKKEAKFISAMVDFFTKYSLLYRGPVNFLTNTYVVPYEFDSFESLPSSDKKLSL